MYLGEANKRGREVEQSIFAEVGRFGGVVRVYQVLFSCCVGRHADRPAMASKYIDEMGGTCRLDQDALGSNDEDEESQ